MDQASQSVWANLAHFAGEGRAAETGRAMCARSHAELVASLGQRPRWERLRGESTPICSHTDGTRLCSQRPTVGQKWPDAVLFHLNTSTCLCIKVQEVTVFTAAAILLFKNE